MNAESHFRKAINHDKCIALAQILDANGFSYSGTYRDGGTVVYGYKSMNLVRFQVGNVANNPAAPFGYVEIFMRHPAVCNGGLVTCGDDSARLSRNLDELKTIVERYALNAVYEFQYATECIEKIARK